MGRGPKKHLKRLNAPSHWMLDKLTGRYAPKPSAGPHKSRECLPLVVFLRNRLKLALTYDETKKILMTRQVEVDAKVRTDVTYPCGFMDVISVPKTNSHYRLLFDVKGRFIVHPIAADEAEFKLCKVKKTALGAGGVPYVVTHDGRTIRYPHPDIKVNDTIQVITATNTIGKFIKFDTGVQVMVTGGRNTGRIGTVVNRERHPGSFDIVHIKDAVGHEFATRSGNVFVLGSGDAKKKCLIKLPAGRGIALSIAEERDRNHAARAKSDARAASA